MFLEIQNEELVSKGEKKNEAKGDFFNAELLCRYRDRVWDFKVQKHCLKPHLETGEVKSLPGLICNSGVKSVGLPGWQVLVTEKEKEGREKDKITK